MQLSVRDVARLLEVTERTVLRWIREEGLPARRVDDQVRLNRAELLEWATANRVAVPPRVFREEGPPASLVAALRAGGILHGIEAGTKEEALEAVVQAIPLPPGVDRESLLRVLLAREALASTGIGGGVAIPHARNPIVLQVDSPRVCLGFLARPVDFDALDGRPVFALFSVVSPTTRDHLQLLARIAYALQDPGFRTVIEERGPAERVLRETKRVEDALGLLAPSRGGDPS